MSDKFNKKSFDKEMAVYTPEPVSLEDLVFAEMQTSINPTAEELVKVFRRTLSQTGFTDFSGKEKEMRTRIAEIMKSIQQSEQKEDEYKGPGDMSKITQVVPGKYCFAEVVVNGGKKKMKVFISSDNWCGFNPQEGQNIPVEIIQAAQNNQKPGGRFVAMQK